MPEPRQLATGDLVIVPWGLGTVVGRISEVYGPPTRRFAVVTLTPALSGDVVDEATTVSVPLDTLKRRDR
jgi:hypothetical protein